MELKTKIILTIVSVVVLMIVGFPSIYGTFALLCDLKAYGVDETCLMCIKALREMSKATGYSYGFWNVLLFVIIEPLFCVALLIATMFKSDKVRFILGIIINLILISIFCRLADAFNAKIEKNLLKKHPDSPLINLMPILTRIAKVVIIFVLLAGFLQSFGYNVNSLIAGFGITGLAVGFAAKEAIGNVFGSIGLLADRVYKVGDYIAFDGYEGTVTEVNFRSTTIKTIQGFDVNIPNNLLANNEITNVSKATERRIDLTVDIEYGTMSLT